MTADAWGIDEGWWGTDGTWHAPSAATVEAIRQAMGPPGGRPVWVVRPGAADRLEGRCRLALEDGTDVGEVDQLPGDLPMGIHDLVPLDGGPATSLVVSPGRCHLPEDLREWGVTVQVPTARSRSSWGIGDLADVRALSRWIATRGGSALALSPLHAPTPVEPIATSPYYPSSRRWRSPLLIRVDEVAPLDEAGQALAAEARTLLDDPLVRRDDCWSRQRAALERIWKGLPDSARADAERWRADQGPELDQWATFCALAERHGHSWRDWPDALRHPGSPAVRHAAAADADRVSFHAWLQQLVEAQLETARTPGVRIIQDLAVGVDPGGADAWAHQDLLADGFSVGAPPDQFELEGQSWGLPPWIPWRLRDVGYRPLASLLRAAMVAGGGLRIDHVMGLTRLFWVPEGGEPADGAYVRFAGQELLDVVALESVRARAIVVGEDLGTVEEGLREALRDRRLLSTRVVWFEADPPEAWPGPSLAMVTTHDLPTLAGMASGRDAPGPMRENLERLTGDLTDRPYVDVATVVHGHLGRSRSALALATLEDLLGMADRPNEPGTTDTERPNWSEALPIPIDDLPAHETADRILDALATGRRVDGE